MTDPHGSQHAKVLVLKMNTKRSLQANVPLVVLMLNNTIIATKAANVHWHSQLKLMLFS